jgi:hypothetical protein
MANNSGKGAGRSTKDKQMASRLRAEGVTRTGGVCCICYRPIGNDRSAEAHYGAHARGADSN